MKRLAVLLAFSLLAGCWDRNELEELAFVVVIGVDQGKEGNILVTFQIANPPAGLPKTAKGNEASTDIATFAAPDFLSVRDLANSTIARQITYSHTRILVFGEELARSKQFNAILTSALRDREIRREMNLIISKEPAYEFIRKNHPVLETRPHKYYEFMSVRWKETGMVPMSTLQRYAQRYESNDDAYLAIYASTKRGRIKNENEDEYKPGEINKFGSNPTEVIGSAYFMEGRMIGSITGEENRMALELRRKALAKVFMTTYRDPENTDKRIAVRLIKKGKTKVKMDLSKEPARIWVEVPLNVELLAVPSRVDYVTDMKKQKELAESISKQLEAKYNAFIEKTQKEFKSDPFNWSLAARKHFLTVQAFKRYNWKEHYPHAKVTVKVKITIKGFGKEIKPLKKEM